MSRILTDEPIRRERVLWHTGHHGEVTVETRQDVEPILREAHENRKERRGYKGDGFHHVAQIPTSVYEDLMRRGIANDPEALKKWLESEEGKVWKTHPGRLR